MKPAELLTLLEQVDKDHKEQVKKLCERHLLPDQFTALHTLLTEDTKMRLRAITDHFLP